MKSAPQCGSGKSCSPTVRPTRCYASTNRRSRQATYPAVCSKRATLLGNVIARNRKPQCGRNFTVHWMLSGHVRAWGRYHSRIIGSMDGEYGPLGRRHSGKGRAVPERPPVDPSPFLFRCAQPILRRIDHATRRWEGMAACPDGSSEGKCVEKSHRFTKYVRPPRGVEAERPSSDGTC